jgi:hypothetical protein
LKSRCEIPAGRLALNSSATSTASTYLGRSPLFVVRMLALAARSCRASFTSVRRTARVGFTLTCNRGIAYNSPNGSLNSLGNLNLPQAKNQMRAGYDNTWELVEKSFPKSPKSPEEIWASREAMVASLPLPQGPYSGSFALIDVILRCDIIVIAHRSEPCCPSRLSIQHCCNSADEETVREQRQA